MMKLSMLILLILPFIKHPLTVGFILIMQTTILCIYTSTMMKTSWYSYIIFITIIGGMMIMFMYMSSITSNEKFKFNKIILFTVIIILMMMIMMNEYLNIMETMNKMLEEKYNMNNQLEQLSTMKLISLNKSNLTIIMIMILLLSMISVTKITNSFKGPLKKN